MRTRLRSGVKKLPSRTSEKLGGGDVSGTRGRRPSPRRRTRRARRCARRPSPSPSSVSSPPSSSTSGSAPRAWSDPPGPGPGLARTCALWRSRASGLVGLRPKSAVRLGAAHRDGRNPAGPTHHGYNGRATRGLWQGGLEEVGGALWCVWGGQQLREQRRC